MGIEYEIFFGDRDQMSVYPKERRTLNLWPSCFPLIFIDMSPALVLRQGITIRTPSLGDR